MSKVIKVTDSTFNQEVLEHDGIVIVDFCAHWCGPCKMFASILEDLSKHYEGKIKIVSLDIEDNKYTASKYDVKTLPTIMFFKNKAIIDVIRNATTRTYMTSCITNALLDNKGDLK